MPTFKEVVEGVGLVIDGAGVLVIVVGLLVATSRYALLGFREAAGYRRFRQDLGRGILLGLEFLVAADTCSERRTWRCSRRPPTIGFS